VKLAYMAPEALTLSHTFVFREIIALEVLGDSMSVYSLRRTPPAATADEARSLVGRVQHVYPVQPARLAGAHMAAAVSHPLRYLRALVAALGDALTACTAQPASAPKLLWHFAVAAVTARDLRRRGVRHIHAHFAHVPTSIAMYAALLAGITFSFTAHANDIFVRGLILRQKARRAAFVVCISEHGRQFLQSLGCDSRKLHVIHCGVDPAAFAPRAMPAADDRPLRLLGLGRLVEKKGFHHLVDACSRLRRQGIAVECTLAGDGPERQALERMVSAKGLQEVVHMIGAVQPDRVPGLMTEADVFVLPCVRDKDGDQDGIPVVLMEAMASGVPVISSSLSGIPELVQDGETGLLVPPGDPEALAASIRAVCENAELWRKLSAGGRRFVEESFSLRGSVRKLRSLFERAIAAEISGVRSAFRGGPP